MMAVFCTRLNWQVANCYMGGLGLISGRKAFQRPMPDGIELLHAIQNVYLSHSVTIA